MNFSLKFHPDEEYYKEAYGEMVSLVRLKKYEPYFAVALFFFGIYLYLKDTEKVLGMFPFAFSIAGIYEFFKLFYERKKWLSDRLDSKIVGNQIEINFKHDGISIKGTFSNGELKWEGVKTILKTKKGILLKPENGVSIYIQDKLLSSKDQIDFLFSKSNKNP
ncbi:MAG: hypothetical protein ACRCVT_13835 [Leadbetterella sp.]